MSDYHQSTTPIKISRQKDKQRLDLFGGANGLNESNESSSEAFEDPVPFHVSLSAMLVSSCLTNSLIKMFAP